MTRIDVLWNGTNGAAAVNGTNAEQFNALGGGSIVYDTTHVVDGTTALKVTPASGQIADVLVKSGLNTPQIAITVPNWYQSVATADEELLRIEDTGNAKILSLLRAGSGKLSITDGTGTAPRLWISATTTPPINAWVKAKIWLQIGSTAATGSVKAAFYDSTNTIIGTAAGGIDSPGFSSTAATLGTTNIGRFFIGRTGTQTTTDARWFGTVSYDTAATGLLADYVAATPSPVGTLTDNRALIVASSGTAPFTISPTTGVTTLSSGQWLVPKDATNTVNYTISDANSKTAVVAVPPIPSGGTPNLPLKPIWTGTPGSNWG